MPGFTIHIAIAKQYTKKHSTEIKNEEKFDLTILDNIKEYISPYSEKSRY